MMRFANDAPGRDPVEWLLEITTDKGQKMYDTVIAQTIKEPERFAKEKFELKNPTMVKEIKFTFGKNRYGENLLEIN